MKTRILHVTSWAMDVRELNSTRPGKTTRPGLLEKILLAFVDLWLGTCRFRCLGGDNLYPFFDSGRPVITAIWHSSLIYTLYRFKMHQAVVMVSGSRDGEWVARALSHWGQIPMRGSKHKGGLAAIKKMGEMVRKYGYNAGIVADGSRGPAGIAQNGPVVLARDTGAPLVPLGFASSPAYRFNSWDRTILPLPFSRVVLACGKPLFIPEGTRGSVLANYRERLQNALNQATALAEKALQA